MRDKSLNYNFLSISVGNNQRSPVEFYFEGGEGFPLISAAT